MRVSYCQSAVVRLPREGRGAGKARTLESFICPRRGAERAAQEPQTVREAHQQDGTGSATSLLPAGTCASSQGARADSGRQIG